MLAMIIVDQMVWGFSVLKGFEVSFSWLAWLFNKQIRTLAHHIAGRAAFKVCLLRICFKSLWSHPACTCTFSWTCSCWKDWGVGVQGLEESLKSPKVWKLVWRVTGFEGSWTRKGLKGLGLKSSSSWRVQGVAFSKSAVKLGESLKLEVIKTLQCKAWSF